MNHYHKMPNIRYTLAIGVISMVKSVKGLPPVGQDSQEEMTVVLLRIKGQGDTLRKGFDALNHAFAALGQGSLGGSTKRLSTGLNKTADIHEEDRDAEVERPGEAEVADDGTIEATTAPPNGKPRPVAKPKYIDEFDLSVSDKPWKDFAGEHAPKTDNERYLLAALWVTENAGTPEFSINHVFTLFRAARWNEQVDFSQPIRYMKRKNSYFEHPSPKTWKLTQIGQDAAREIAKVGPQ
jgi:hypothetical protein